MKISVFTTATRPEQRGDLWRESKSSYWGFADEVTVRGAWWPQEFEWPYIGQQFQSGYEQCEGDWVVHADLDFIFHERDYDGIRQAFKDNPNAPALSFWKYQFILPDRYNLKSRLVIAVNKGKYGDRIKFDSGGDLCQPSLDGKELKPDDVPEARVPFYNYEKLLKTEVQIRDDVGRMARAWERHFGDFKLGGPDDGSAYEKWLEMTVGRFNARSAEHIRLNEHPLVMQETITKLKPTQWGYNGLGNLPTNDYARGDA